MFIQKAIITQDFLDAASSGNAAKLEQILSNSNIDVNVTNQVNRTALILAALHNHIECARVLLNNLETKVDLQDYQGTTALMHPATKCHSELLKLLLAHQANVKLN